MISIKVNEIKFCNWMKKNIGFIIANTVFGILIYFLLMSNSLVNSYDGIWHTTRFISDDWERSLGRWLLPYLDYFRFGLVSVPINTILTLSVIAISNALIKDIFDLDNSWVAFLLSALFIASPVISNTLSYCFTSLNYGIAYFFAVIAVYCVIKMEKMGAGVIWGSIFISLSLGSYQAYLGVTCLVFIMYLIYKLQQHINSKLLLCYMVKVFMTILFGGVLYQVLSALQLNFYKISLSDYRGADKISLMNIIKELPYTVQDAYKTFYNFYFTNEITNNIFGIKQINIIITVVVAVLFVSKLKKTLTNNIINTLILIGGIVCLPIGCNIMLILTNNSINMLMAGAMALCIPLILFMIYCVGGGYKKVSIVLMIVLLYQNIFIISNDQLSLKEGRISTISITQEIITRLVDKNYLNEEQKVAFVGIPSGNELFRKSDAFNSANDYAKFGEWWELSSCNIRSWNGVITEYCGIELNFCEDKEYEDIILNEIIKTVPNFPDEKAITVIDGIVVIKVSDIY